MSKYRDNLSNKKKKSLSFFYTLFLVISLIIISVIITTFIIFNNVYSRHLKEAINEANLKNLSQIKNSYLTMNDFVESFLMRLTNDLKAKQLIYTQNTNENAYDINLLMKWMGSYRANTAFLSSLYLYNNETKTFYSIGNYNVIRDYDEMYDRDIIDIIDSLPPENNKIILIPRIIPSSPYTETKTKKVYTYIMTKSNYNTNKLEYVYVVNVESSWIEDNVLDISYQNLEEDSQLIIINNDNIVFAHSDKSLFATKLLDIEYMNKIKAISEDREFIEWEIDSENYLISYDSTNDVHFINLTKEDILYERIKATNQIALIITFLFLLIGLFISYVIARGFYGPILKLRNKVQELFSRKSLDANPSSNEFAYMNSMFTNVYKDYVELELFKNQNIKNIRHKILLDMLESSHIDSDSFYSTYGDYNFAIDFNQKMQILVFTIDDFKQIEYDGKKTGMHDLLYTLLVNRFEDVFKTEIIHIEESYLVLLNISEDLSEDLPIQDYIYNTINEIKDIVFSDFEYTISAAISTISKDISYLSNTYKLTKDIMSYRFVKGNGCILTADVLSETKEDFELPVDLTKKILESIKLAKLSESLKYCNQIFNYLSEYSISDIQLGLSYVMVSLIDGLSTVSLNANIDFDINFVEFSTYISKISTLEKIEAAFEKLIAEAIDKINYQDKNKHNLLIEEIIRYINENYNDYSLTPNLIALEKGLTLKYTNHIFKKHTGVSIAYYINETRLESAKNLLLESNLSIDSILDKIGWENRAYFFTLFKKQYGATPNAFRSNIKS